MLDARADMRMASLVKSLSRFPNSSDPYRSTLARLSMIAWREPTKAVFLSSNF
jgi:hypothetical protein